MGKQFYADCNQRFNDWKSDPDNYAKNNVYIAASGQEKSFFYKDKQYEYMPEFFLGNPYSCSAVILNLNPGTADLGFHCKDSTIIIILLKHRIFRLGLPASNGGSERMGKKDEMRGSTN